MKTITIGFSEENGCVLIVEKSISIYKYFAMLKSVCQNLFLTGLI